MLQRESSLHLDFETVSEFINHPEEMFLSSDYIRGVRKHTKRYQPDLAKLIDSQPIFSPARNRYFRSGAYSTYDLILTADYEYWTHKELHSQILKTTQQNFREAVLTKPDGEVQTRDNRIVTDISGFYQQLTQDSPLYHQWLQMRVDTIRDPRLANDFIYGSVLTAMPFYATREGERLARLFSL